MRISALNEKINMTSKQTISLTIEASTSIQSDKYHLMTESNESTHSYYKSTDTDTSISHHTPTSDDDTSITIVAEVDDQFVLLPNEWKMMIIVYFGVWIGAVAFYLFVGYPFNITSKIFGILTAFNAHPVIQQLFFLA
eukprot:343161_1